LGLYIVKRQEIPVQPKGDVDRLRPCYVIGKQVIGIAYAVRAEHTACFEDHIADAGCLDRLPVTFTVVTREIQSFRVHHFPFICLEEIGADHARGERSCPHLVRPAYTGDSAAIRVQHHQRDPKSNRMETTEGVLLRVTMEKEGYEVQLSLNSVEAKLVTIQKTE
jgi:hypothetical protein